MARRRAHYVLSTHWDREWYQTFQDFRYRLVELLDRVFEGLADGRLAGPFQTDGQAIILEDYLDVRPERRQQVEQFARDRKLVIGPWYVLPDEFLVSGESLIRNLRMGRQMARSFGGEPSNAGFVCDLFGHNSQTPQIFAGFGIRGGFVWRGLNTVETRHVLWRGADGTVLPCYRFGHHGYTGYADAVRHSFDQDHVFDARQASADLAAFLADQAQHTEIDPILLFDGGDHQEWDQPVYAVLAEQMRRSDGEFEIVHTCLDDYLEEMLSQTDRIATTVEGELREPGRHPGDVDNQWVIPGVLSSRVWVKQANAECQTLLCNWAEPFAALAHAALGCELPQGYLDVAWRWLLENHPHDSICGCSIDQVHEDMKFRFSQCRQIADRLTCESTSRIAASVEGDVADDELRVVLFNPMPHSVEQIAELKLQIPTDWPTFNEFFGFEPKPAFRVFDADGQEIPYQRLAQDMNRSKRRLHGVKFPQTYGTHDVTVALPVRVPALGYSTLTVRAGEPGRPTRHPEAPGLATSNHSMANEHLAVSVESNGTVTLTDKRNHQTYEGLLTFEDTADIGDGWYHGMAVNDQAFTSVGCPCDVALVHNGPMLATLRVRTTMSVPAEFCFDRMRRSERFVPMVVDTLVTLRAGCEQIEMQTIVHNDADDHRLRVLLPSAADAEAYLADTPFDVVRRPIALREDNHLYREVEVETKPQQSWTAVHDDRRGLAVVSEGLCESAVRDWPERPIALTLFRATRRTVMTDGEPAGQLRATMVFRYWIMPLHGKPDVSRLCRMGQQIAAGLRDVQVRAPDAAQYADGAKLPPSGGWFEIDGAPVVTSVRQVGEGLEVRMFNPTDKPTTAALRPGELWRAGWCPRQVECVDFESRPVEHGASLSDGICEVSLKPKQIVTLRLT